MLKIREFSKLCNCSVYTLRYYDQIGLLKPSIINNNSGYRFYDETQLDEYIQIKDFQSIGFSILEIQSLNKKTNKQILIMIDRKVEHLEEKKELAIYLKEKYFGGK
ncbi:MAG: MerR family transcriptional regulator [Thomasclavelia sp.]|nr:MerR family transcriptional regulator [Thomasclavelia sp.]